MKQESLLHLKLSLSKTLIENLGYNISSNKVEFVNGYKNLVNVIPTIKARCAEGGKVVIIFDADSLGNNGGYETRKKEIEEVLGENNAQAELFLFPNNEEDGDFEKRQKKFKVTYSVLLFSFCMGSDPV